MTRQQMLRVMTSEELTYWEAFNEIDPISLHHRVDLGAGVVASTLVNKEILDAKKHTKPVDFMPVFMQAKAVEEEKKSSSPGELRNFMRSLIARQKSKRGE